MNRRRSHIFTRRQTAPRVRLPIGLLLIVVVVGLCLLIPVSPLSVVVLDESFGQDLPTPPPTFTLPTQPTK